MAAQIFRIQNIENPEEFILLKSQHQGNDDDDDTPNFSLLATEGDTAYVSQVKANRTHTLRSKNSPVTQKDFDIVLSALLKGKGKSMAGIAALKDVEVVASVDQMKSITLIIRKRTADITQRMGSLTLTRDKNQEDDVLLYDWCGQVLQSKDALKDELFSLKAKVEVHQETVTSLMKQLEELLLAKKQHETLILEKAALLLNEKKLKIRDQQRLLSTATIDQEKLDNVRATRTSGRKKASGRSAKYKRKATTLDEDDDESDAFDKMDKDAEPEANNSDDVTTEAAETDDDEDDAAPPPSRSKAKGRLGITSDAADDSPPDAGDDDDDEKSEDYPTSKTKSRLRGAATKKTSEEETTKPAKKEAGPIQPDNPVTPPRRELPSIKDKGKPEPANPVDPDETESDDEL